MKILGIQFVRPTLFRFLRLLLAGFVTAGTVYGVGDSIDGGRVTNQPEVLRHIVFWSFSIALAYRTASDFGLSENSLGYKVSMVIVFYLPIGLAFAMLVGLI